ncbi:MAG: hypothetical protein JJU13_09595 [Balneolaceae bacterium]|nr:hypothetical protein [Balneolaceae bacterium]
MKQQILTFTFAVTTILFFSLSSASQTQAQSTHDRGFDIDIDPIVFALNGFSFHGGYIAGAYRFDLGVFGLDIPEWLHGNEDFDSSFIGAGWKVDRFFKGYADGFFAGVDGGVSRITVTHTAADVDKDRIQYMLGLRGGYRWNTGLGNLFVTPWIGLGYTLNAKDVEIEGDIFESSSLTPFPTVHIGWRF